MVSMLMISSVNEGLNGILNITCRLAASGRLTSDSIW
jgi:hypothetical protein